MATVQHYCTQERQPWIENDLTKILLVAQLQKFEGSQHFARLDISENGEHFLQDGLHRIPAIFSSNDSSEGSLHLVTQLENGMAIKVLVHSYNIIRTKDGAFQFHICVDNWERVTDDLLCSPEQLTNVNSLENVQKCLQNCIIDITGDKGSGSQMPHSQLHDDSQNLSALIKLANQSDTSSQSQQQCNILEASYQLNNSVHNSEKVTNKSISSDASNCRLTMDICPAKTSEALVELTSKEILPKSTNTDSCMFLVNSQKGSICQPNQEVWLHQQSNVADLPEHSSEKNNETCIQAEAETYISPTQLLEMMALETQLNDGYPKCDQKKPNCSDIVRKTSPITHRSAVVHGGEASGLQLPALEDLLIPSDQRGTLAQLEDWCSSNNTSQDISSCPAFLLSSSLNNTLSSENLLLQPTMKETKKYNKPLPETGPTSAQSDQELIQEDCSEKSEQNVNNNFLGSNCDSDMCDGHSSTENERNSAENEQNYTGNERSRNSSSLFSDTDDISFSDEKLISGIKPNEDKTSQQEKNFLVVNFPELNENNKISKKRRLSGRDESDVIEQSCDKMRKFGHVTDDQSQICEIDSSQMDTADSLITEAPHMMCEPHSSTNLNGKCVDKINLASNESSTKRDRKTCTEICIISSSDGISDMELDSTTEATAERSNAQTAIMLNIDMPSTDDIYMIAGHDIYSSSDNLVTSTDSEITSSCHSCHMSTQTEPHASEALSAACCEPRCEVQRTTDTKVTNDCSINEQDCTKSPSSVKSNSIIASPEINQMSSTKLQNLSDIAVSQDFCWSNSATSQPGNRFEQTTDSTSYTFPSKGKVSSQLSCTTLSTPKTCPAADLVLPSALKKIAAVINKDMFVKTNDALTTQESDLHKVPVASDLSMKDQECYMSLLMSPGKGKSSSSLNSSKNSSEKVNPYVSAPKKCPSSVPESPPKEVKVLVSDIMIAGWGSVLSEAETHFSDSSENSCFTRSKKKRLALPIEHGSIQEKKKQNLVNRLFRSETDDQFQTFSHSKVHTQKKHFSVCIAVVGQHAPDVLEIKRFSEQSVGRRLCKNSSSERSYQPSGIENNDSTEHFTEIKEKDSNRLEEIQNKHDHLYVEGERKPRAKTSKNYKSIIPRIERTEKEKSVTDTNTKIPFCKCKKKKLCKCKKKHGTSTGVPISSNLDILQVPQPQISFTASSSSSDCTDVTSHVGCCAVHQIQENNDSLSGQPGYQTQEIHDSLSGQPEYQTQEIHDSLSGQHEYQTQEIHDSLSGQHEYQTQEIHDSLSGQLEFSPTPPTHLAPFESQGFVPSVCEDDRRDSAPQLSLGFVSRLTDSLTVNSDDDDSLEVFDKLKQSVASAVSYICHGKFL